MFSIHNPFDLTFLAQYQYFTDNQVDYKLEISRKSFDNWRFLTIHDRIKFIKNLIFVLTNKADLLTNQCTLEMGKPIKQSQAEVKKCISLCEYYMANAIIFLKPQNVDSGENESFITYEPLGTILGVMPWNFPYWQVFRFAIPAILAGNTVVVKHASNVPGCAQLIEDMFTEAGFPEGVYQNLLISGKQVERIIDDPVIKGVSVTGSEKAGAEVAARAAKNIKKAVLELGGSNAFIVLQDADIDKAAEIAVNARMQNTGQSCIAAKRFLVHEAVYEDFIEKFRAGVEALTSGDPMNEDTDIGPLARVDLAEEVEKQVAKSVDMGAKVITGHKRTNAFYEPTIVIDVTPDMPVFEQETFGPVAAVIKFKTFEEAVQLSNGTNFGLGVTVFTRDIEFIKSKAAMFDEGAVFINAMVKSDPALPFGGVKRSGFGRELAENGIKEFVNVKTVFIG